MLELTIPHESRIDVGESLKTEKCSRLVDDIGHNWEIEFKTLEIGVRGVLTAKNKSVLAILYELCNPNSPPFKIFTRQVITTALLGSYFMFLARKESDWPKNIPLINFRTF